MSQDFLQKIKLQISRTFKLTIYERIAFHKILSITRSESGKKILLKDLQRIAEVRKNAIYILKDFNDPEVSDALMELFQTDITLDEKFIILEHLEYYGSEKYLSILIDLVKENIKKTTEVRMLSRLVDVIGSIGKGLPEVNSFLQSLATDKAVFEKVRCAAIRPEIFDNDLSFFEDILLEKNDNISYAIYEAISKVADLEMKKVIGSKDNDLFTPTLGDEDKLLLDIRVLLGKMTVSFDDYSSETKTSFILAMISCGHREFLIYTMKCLTSHNKELIDMTLYIIRDNVKKIQSPVKLFRNLIYLSSTTPRDNKLIVEIFVKYFSNLKENRTTLMTKNTVYNYIVVTLDSYFESYRKNFMIPEIMEKDYPVEFQEIRKFVLNKFSPDIKRRIISNLGENDFSSIKNLLLVISESTPTISEDEMEALKYFIEVMLEKDEKAREVANTRLHDIDFEKKYLKNRIIRLCEIIQALDIQEASTNLVKIFNYVKKYSDKEIYKSVTYTLSILNYPYMLGELEVLLVSGDEKEKEWAVKLFALFSEQRSVNIMLDYLSENSDDESDLILLILSIIVKRNLANDVSANEIAKKIIDTNSRPEIVNKAIVMLGKTFFEKDIEYLNNLFMNTSDVLVKEGIVQAIELIIETLTEFNRRDIIEMLEGYLKDPGIRVRILACTILLKLKHFDALKTIQDMMVIRNKTIQREILHILRNNVITELGYFFIFLLREEYGISLDLIPMLKLLPPEEIKEIDHFIVNVFKKFEGSNYDAGYKSKSDEIEKEKKERKNFKKKDITTLYLQFLNLTDMMADYNAMELSILYNSLIKDIMELVKSHSGDIARSTNGLILAYFDNALEASICSKSIYDLIGEANTILARDNKYRYKLFLISDKKEIVNTEVLITDSTRLRILGESHLTNRIAVDKKTSDMVKDAFKVNILPSGIFNMRGNSLNFYELESFINFLSIADKILDDIKASERERDKIAKELEESKRAQALEGRSSTTVAFANAMDDIGQKLKNELNELNRYISKRSTDRELIRNVEKRLIDIHKLYMLEASKVTID